MPGRAGPNYTGAGPVPTTPGPVPGRWQQALADSDEVVVESEVDRYLLDPIECPPPKEAATWSLLHWWKLNGCKYPNLALVAKDVLAIQVSTVASESSFSTGGRVIDPFRSSLTPKTVEALLCLQNWIKKRDQSEMEYYPSQEELEFYEKMERGLRELLADDYIKKLHGLQYTHNQSNKQLSQQTNTVSIQPSSTFENPNVLSALCLRSQSPLGLVSDFPSNSEYRFTGDKKILLVIPRPRGGTGALFRLVRSQERAPFSFLVREVARPAHIVFTFVP
ncbi:hypothetical protein ACLB2K_073855 [Fragaria x ananassa]